MGKSKDLATLTDDSVTFNAGGTFTAVKAASTQYTDFELLDTTNNYAWIMSNRGTSPASFEILTRDASNTYTQPLKIDASGRVTMPYQPFFDGYMYTTGALAADTILALSQSSNTGITLGNNNTRLTVPVDGYYFIHASQMAQTINGMYAYFSLLVNGTVKYHSHNNFFSESNKDFHITKVVHMAANDYIEFAWLYIGVSNAWSGTHSTVSVHKLG